MTDPALEQLADLMPTHETKHDPTWPPVGLDWDSEVRVIDPLPDHPTFSEEYIPPPPFLQEEPEPIARLRHRDTWSDLHRLAVDRIRVSLGEAQAQLRDTQTGCREFNYHPEVRAQVDKALDQVIEALRLIDIYDPE